MKVIDLHTVRKPILRFCVACGATFPAARAWYTTCKACYHGERAVRALKHAARHMREATR